MPKKVMKKYMKETGALAFGGVIVGSSGAVIGKMGLPAAVSTPVQAGMGTLGSGIGMVAPISAMKVSVGLLGSTMEGFHKMPSGRMMKGKHHKRRR